METLGAPSDPISISLHAVSLSIELDSISDLINTPRFAQTRQYLESSIHDGTNPDGDPNFVVAVSALSIEIGNEIYQLFESAREIYQWKFLELGAFLNSEEDYFSAVKRIESETDPTRVDLNGIFPPVWMPRAIEALSRNKSALPEEKIARVLESCDRGLALHAARRKLIDFVESRVGRIAPNLFAFVGSEALAVKFVGAAGGLTGLAEMPADDVALLGARRVGGGYVEEIDVVWSKGRRARGAVARHVGMAARLDVEGKDPTGGEGREMMQRIREALDGACSDDGACFDGGSSGIATVRLRVRRGVLTIQLLSRPRCPLSPR